MDFSIMRKVRIKKIDKEISRLEKALRGVRRPKTMSQAQRQAEEVAQINNQLNNLRIEKMRLFA